MKNNGIIIRLTTCGVLIGASFVLSFIKIVKFPFGGSITLFSMVPIVLAAILFGTPWGVLTAFGYSLLQLLQSILTSESFVLDAAWKTVLMILLDFLLAFTVLGLSGIFVNRQVAEYQNINMRGALGALLATFLRYIMHTISGAILFGTYAEWFFGEAFVTKFGTWAMSSLDTNALSVVYSAVYNGIFMVPEMIMTSIAVYFILKIPQIRKVFTYKIKK